MWIFTESLSQQVAWFQLKDRLWLEVTLEPENLPGASAHFVWWEDDIFKQHLLAHCDGWCIRNNRGAKYLQELGIVQEDKPFGGLVIGEAEDG